MCIIRISTVGYRVVNVNGACNRSDNDGCSRAMPLGILVVSSLPRSYSTYNRDTDTVRKLITCPLRPLRMEATLHLSAPHAGSSYNWPSRAPEQLRDPCAKTVYL